MPIKATITTNGTAIEWTFSTPAEAAEFARLQGVPVTPAIAAPPTIPPAPRKRGRPRKTASPPAAR